MKMFWGLILKANKKYTQLLEKPFHLTKASLDHSNADNEPIQVMYSDGESTFLLCTLQKGKELQCSLDLNFAEGDTVCFSTKGNGIVHLTGYLIPDDDFNYDGMNESLDEEEEEEEDETVDLREILEKKKKQKEKDKGAAKKKAVAQEESDDDDDEEEDDDEEGSEEEGAAVNGSLNSSGDMEEDDDEDDDDDDEEDDSEEATSDDDEKVAPPKPKQAKLDPQQLKKKQQNGVDKNGVDKKKDKVQQKQQQQQQLQKENKSESKVQKLQGGLLVEDVKAGNGAEAKPGKKIQVTYVGRLKSNNKVFDSTKSGPGFKLTLGRGEVIKGWDLGLAGMKVGGKRRLTIPPGLAYGAKGNPPVIPANSTLVFDVELKNVF